jgi:hypothetical protein
MTNYIMLAILVGSVFELGRMIERDVQAKRFTKYLQNKEVK